MVKVVSKEELFRASESGDCRVVVGPIEDGYTAEDMVARHQDTLEKLGMARLEVECLAFEVYPEVKVFAEGEAQFERVSGTFWASLK